jgi:hypothetical protein
MPDPRHEFDRRLRQRLSEIRAMRAQFDIDDQIPGATRAEVDKLAADVRHEFQFVLPEPYLHFLTLQNGGGEHVGFYGTRPLDEPMRYVAGFMEENRRERLGRASPFKSLIVFGYTDLDHVVFDIETAKYRLRSKIGGDFYDDLGTIEDVIWFGMGHPATAG